jgi:hypothetical protein
MPFLFVLKLYLFELCGLDHICKICKYPGGMINIWYIQYYYFSLGFGFVFEDEITSDFLVRSALIPAGKRGKSLIITLLYSTVFHNVCWTAKTQSGGDFVCHILQKMKTVWQTYLKWYCNVWGMLPQQDFDFYPVIIFSNWLSLPQG